MKITKIAVMGLIAALLIAAGTSLYHMKRQNPVLAPIAVVTSPVADVATIDADAKEILANYRKVIVLIADEKKLTKKELEESVRVGQELFHGNQDKIAKLNEKLDSLLGSSNPARFETLNGLLDYVESDRTLFDADRLAFREVLQSLLASVARDTSLTAVKMHKRISEDLEALNEIEHNYEKELGQIFGHFDQRGIELKREKWDDYVVHLKSLYSREQILKESGVILPNP
ncbi:MAG: polysaccharide deacetylase, partial [Burkholderiaceae bacterium]